MRVRALLLGPNGQLGSELRRAHGESGESVDLVPLGRDKLDVAARRAIERVIGGLDFDVLVNCAAYTAVDDAEVDADLAFAVNAHAVQAMARVCAAKRARLLHVGTDYVFGGDPTLRRPLREDDPTAPVNVYGVSKAMGETLARQASEDVVIVRVATLFGVAGAGGRAGNFVEAMIRSGREARTLRVVDDQTVSPTAAADVARVVMRMLAEGCEPGLYHLVNTGAATWCDFAREIVRLAGVETAVVTCASEDYPTRAPRPRYSALDNTRVSAAFGAMPAWQDALGAYLRERGHAAGQNSKAPVAAKFTTEKSE